MLALSAFFAGAATRLTLENGINIVFEGCADGSVRFEALGKKPSAPVKEFELSREVAADDFVQAEDGSYRWNGYTVIPAADGYTLLFNGEELYTSSFNEEPSLLREIRNWKTATEFYGFGEASRNVSLRNQSFAIWNVSKYGDHAYLFIPFYVTNTNTCVYYNAGSNDRIYFQDGKDFQVQKRLSQDRMFRTSGFISRRKRCEILQGIRRILPSSKMGVRLHPVKVRLQDAGRSD